MEGVLHKWTNYLSGWQPRYFVLDGTVLSYYDSQEDVGKGSKGSIKMAVCEIKVHTADFTRMDLIIPGEQYFYLKAVNAAERQKWLVALGSAKACLADSRSKKEREISETEDTLKSKMSELRLYCDLLMQQVHKIQESAQPLQANSTPDVEVLYQRLLSFLMGARLSHPECLGRNSFSSSGGGDIKAVTSAVSSSNSEISSTLDRDGEPIGQSGRLSWSRARLVPPRLQVCTFRLVYVLVQDRCTYPNVICHRT
ncbi:pleckstrin homology domain-containing family A member 3-like [Rhincodon typus]|uniref:pleckstrin homology domain-containing family A member 3-like n=1 Tax=Rhincodon typus TaxID=259920 RepID=UPI002030EBBC|nr:pleckstrin homology domain-containing family A member 3-like [Rhincodon typus]